MSQNDKKEQGYAERIAKTVAQNTVDGVTRVAEGNPITVIAGAVKDTVDFGKAILGQKNRTDDN